eukprot:scaffold8150_cov72-Phaeocystis_antarctica.AAC.1
MQGCSGGRRRSSSAAALAHQPAFQWATLGVAQSTGAAVGAGGGSITAEVNCSCGAVMSCIWGAGGAASCSCGAGGATSCSCGAGT